MKAVVTFEMPRSCADCPLSDFDKCKVMDERDAREQITMFLETKHPKCPLNPLPEKKEVIWGWPQENRPYNLGFNECLNKVTETYRDRENRWWEEHSSRFD